MTQVQDWLSPELAKQAGWTGVFVAAIMAVGRIIYMYVERRTRNKDASETAKDERIESLETRLNEIQSNANTRLDAMQLKYETRMDEMAKKHDSDRDAQTKAWIEAERTILNLQYNNTRLESELDSVKAQLVEARNEIEKLRARVKHYKGDEPPVGEGG